MQKTNMQQSIFFHCWSSQSHTLKFRSKQYWELRSKWRFSTIYCDFITFSVSLTWFIECWGRIILFLSSSSCPSDESHSSINQYGLFAHKKWNYDWFLLFFLWFSSIYYMLRDTNWYLLHWVSFFAFFISFIFMFKSTIHIKNVSISIIKCTFIFGLWIWNQIQSIKWNKNYCYDYHYY
jgi:hypothetical protein